MPCSNLPTRLDKLFVVASRRLCELDSRRFKTVADKNLKFNKHVQRNCPIHTDQSDATKQFCCVGSGVVNSVLREINSYSVMALSQLFVPASEKMSGLKLHQRTS